MNNNAMHNTTKKNDRGFTLIELLVVIAILGALSGMFALAYRGAAQEASAQKTRTTVQKVSRVINSIYEQNALEPLGVSFSPNWVPASAGIPSRTARIERTKLALTRDRMRFEMPDCADDLKWTQSTFASGTGTSPDRHILRTYKMFHATIDTLLAVNGNSVVFSPNMSFPNYPISSRAIRLMRKLSQVENGAFVPRYTIDPDDVTKKIGWEATNANAELLYLIIEDSTFDGSSAIELFGKAEIGDTDNDGLNEILDAFNKPICWLRWPSGFSGMVFAHPDPLDPALITTLPNGQRRLTIGDEPYDLMGMDPGWGTNFPPEPLGQPLVVSAGNDRSFGIRIGLQGAIKASRNSAAAVFGYPDPWFPRDNAAQRLGSRLGGGELSQDGDEPSKRLDDSSDNITNLDADAA
ncbi:MAG: type II secretion system protein [bacterium]